VAQIPQISELREEELLQSLETIEAEFQNNLEPTEILEAQPKTGSLASANTQISETIPAATLTPIDQSVLLSKISFTGNCQNSSTKYGDLSNNTDWLGMATVLIAEEEGFYPNWYDYGDGMWTIGYGHAVLKSEPKDVAEPLSQEQAMQLLKQDLATLPYVAAVENWFTEALTPQQKAAMVSFAYNTGPRGFEKYNIPKENLETIVEGIIHASDSKQPQYPGLLCRRMREAEVLATFINQ